MIGKAVVFEAAERVSIQEFKVDEPGDTEVLAENLVSGVSVGTERWALLGKRPEMRFPHIPGYMGIGRVVKLGEAARKRGYREGQLINFSRSRVPEPFRSKSWMATHVSHAVVDVCVPPWDPEGFNPMAVEPVPEGLDVMQASLTQLAAVALRGIEMATVPAGSKVLVCGLGVVGLYVVQICKLKGALVAATDVVDSRLKVATEYGADWVINGAKESLPAVVAGIAPAGFDIIIDTSSVPAVVNELFPLLKLWGKFVFQGWYAPPSAFDFNALHARLPTCFVPCGHTGRATATAMKWAREGRLDTVKMITHVCRPEEASKVYDMLVGGATGSLGVVFDWRTK